MNMSFDLNTLKHHFKNTLWFIKLPLSFLFGYFFQSVDEN